jgi:TP901 family phage tail tape measure protein
MADLKYRALLDDNDFRKKYANLSRDMGTSLSKMFEKVSKASTKNVEDMLKRINSAVSKAAQTNTDTSEVKSTQAATEALAKSKLAAADATKREKEEQLAFMNALRQSRLEIQASKEAQAQANRAYAEGRISMQQYRKEVALSNQAAKERAAAEREAKKALSDNSQYQQLNRALAELRRQSKDVLAEMFRLEGQGKKNSAAYQDLANKARGLVAQTQYLDRGIKKIDASLGLHQRNVGNYGSALDALSPTFARLNSQMAMMGVNLTELASKPNGIKELGAAFLSMGKNIGAFLLTPVGLVITALSSLFLLISKNFGTIKDFNAGLLNVSKTTGISGAELSKMGDAIISLSRSLQVVDTSKLLEYATIAGQLGVKGTKNIMAFTEALAKLETASDISGEEGGAEIARMLTLVDGGVQNVKAFGDEIVNLGNNFAATEKEILSNAEAISQNVGIYRIGRQDVLAFATATKSVGLEAEVVGSTFSRTLGEFEKTIRTGKGVADLLKVVGGTQEELAKRFKDDAAGVFKDYVRGLNAIHVAGGSVNEALTKTGVVAVRDQRVIASLASNGYAVLEDALNKVRGASGALDQEFKTKSGSLEQQIERISVAWNNLVLDIEKGDGILGKATVAFADGLATIIDRMAKILNPTGWDEFKASLTDFDTADKIRELNLAYKDGLDTLSEIAKVDLGSSNSEKLAEVYNTLTDSLQKIQKEYEKYKKLVNAGILTESGKHKFKDFEALINSLGSRLHQLQIMGVNPTIVAPPTKTSTNTGPAIDTEKIKREREAAIKAQRDLQKEIDEINRESLNATLSRHEQEVAAVEEKYKRIREKIDEFRKDPKYKGQAVDAGALSAAQARDLAQVKYRQDTEALIKELDVQRQLWQEYESWRAELGTESANKQFAGELDVIKGYKARIQSEMALIGAKATVSLFAVPAASVGLTAAEKERFEVYSNELKSLTEQEKSIKQAAYKKMLIDYASYEDKRARLREQANQLMEGADAETRQRIAKQLDEDIKESFRQQIEGSKDFQDIQENLRKAGSFMLITAFKQGKDVIDGLIDGMKEATDQEKKTLKKIFGDFFNEGAEAAKDQEFSTIVSLVDGLGSIVDLSGQFDGSLSNSLRTIGSMVSAAGQLASTLGSALGEAGKGLSSAGGYGAIIGAVLSIFGAFGQAAEQAEQRRLEAKRYAAEFELKTMTSVTRMLEYHISLINDMYGVDRVNHWKEVQLQAYAEINKAIGGLQENYFKNQGDARTDNYRQILNNEYGGDIEAARERQRYLQSRKDKGGAYYKEFIESTEGPELQRLNSIIRYFDTEIPKAYNLGWTKIEDITVEGALELRRAIEAGEFDDITAQYLSNMLDQWEVYRDASNKIKEELTGLNFDTFVNNLSNLFFNGGKDAGKSWMDGFEQEMENHIIHRMTRDFFDKRAQEWNDKYAKYANDGGGIQEWEVWELRKDWQQMGKDAKTYEAGIREATGIMDLSEQENPDSKTFSKAITGITEATGNIIGGELGGLRMAQLQHLEVARANSITMNQQIAILNDSLSVLNSINLNTGRTADNTHQLFEIKTAIVSLNNKITTTDSLYRGAGVI